MINARLKHNERLEDEQSHKVQQRRSHLPISSIECVYKHQHCAIASRNTSRYPFLCRRMSMCRSKSVIISHSREKRDQSPCQPAFRWTIASLSPISCSPLTPELCPVGTTLSSSSRVHFFVSLPVYVLILPPGVSLSRHATWPLSSKRTNSSLTGKQQQA